MNCASGSSVATCTFMKAESHTHRIEIGNRERADDGDCPCYSEHHLAWLCPTSPFRAQGRSPFPPPLRPGKKGLEEQVYSKCFYIEPSWHLQGKRMCPLSHALHPPSVCVPKSYLTRPASGTLRRHGRHKLLNLTPVSCSTRDLRQRFKSNAWNVIGLEAMQDASICSLLLAIPPAADC